MTVPFALAERWLGYIVRLEMVASHFTILIKRKRQVKSSKINERCLEKLRKIKYRNRKFNENNLSPLDNPFVRRQHHSTH